MKKVFILDDDIDIINVLTHILSKHYEIYYQANAEGIYESIAGCKPDLIIMDNFIGEYNANEILSHLRKSDHPVTAPVVLFSAAHNVEEIAASIGTTYYLSKPASIQEIRKTIQDILK